MYTDPSEASKAEIASLLRGLSLKELMVLFRRELARMQALLDNVTKSLEEEKRVKK